MGKYKTSGYERNREDTRKDTKKNDSKKKECMEKYHTSGYERNIEDTRKDTERIFQLPVSTTYTGVITKGRIWPAELMIQYDTMMLYHNIKNSDHNRKVKKVVEEQEQNE